MREGWEYKKLGEVATFVNGYPFKPSDWKDRGKRIIRIQNLNNPNAEYNYYDGSIDSKYLVSNGDVLISWSGSLGVFEWSQSEAILNQHIFKVVFDKGEINKRFFEYVVASRLNEMKAKVHGITMQHITKKDFDVILIPIPPLSVQQSIVSELDMLSGLIAKHEEQLKAYDELAQSIFYDMFGDPVENEKGWEVKKLSECCKNCDSQRKPITAKDRISGDIPYYGASGVVDYVKDYIFDGDYLLISEDGANLILRSTPIAFQIKGKTWVNNHAHVLLFDSLYQQVYLEYSINLRDISMLVTGCAQPKLTQAAMNNMNIPYPPLPLQQSFAEKIEAIERQKERIRQSMAEVKTMFDSRMDYYFN